MQKEQSREWLQPFPEYPHFPEELQEHRQFVVWTYHEVAGRRTKPLYDAKSGRLSSPTDPQPGLLQSRFPFKLPR